MDAVHAQIGGQGLPVDIHRIARFPARPAEKVPGTLECPPAGEGLEEVVRDLFEGPEMVHAEFGEFGPHPRQGALFPEVSLVARISGGETPGVGTEVRETGKDVFALDEDGFPFGLIVLFQGREAACGFQERPDVLPEGGFELHHFRPVKFREVAGEVPIHDLV